MAGGRLFVIAAPSGAGKTSLVRQLRERTEGLSVSVSHTTRPRRPGERDGAEYFFVGHEEFDAMVANGEFLEYARVFDNQYGTLRTKVESQLNAGQDVLLEIDWQGARQIKQLIPECQSIFILPPSREALVQRLQGRRQDDKETIARRMRDAAAEISHYPEYDFLVVNDDFDVALEEIRSIVIARRLTTQRRERQLHQLLCGLLSTA